MYWFCTPLGNTLQTNPKTGINDAAENEQYMSYSAYKI